jgi:hypothetical protein
MKLGLLARLTAFLTGAAAVVACGGATQGSTGGGVDPVTASGQACLAAMNGACEGTVNACNFDPSCASETTSCLDHPGPSIDECMTAAKSPAGQQLFTCMHSLQECTAELVGPHVPDAGPDADGGPEAEAGSTCKPTAPVSADAADQACLAYLQTSCATALAACNTDCDCVTMVTRCLQSPPLGVDECLSVPAGPAARDLFFCAYDAPACNAPPPGVDGGEGG